MTDNTPDSQNPKLEPRKKTEAEKQKEKDAMINLWMGGVGQDTPKDQEKGK